MRRTLILAAAAAIGLASCASAPSSSSTRATGGWSFDYNASNGVSTAEQRDAGGAVTVRVTCRTPDGDMTLSDYVVGAGVRGERDTRFTIGTETIEVRGRGDGRAMEVRLPRRPPNLTAYAHMRDDPVSLSAGGQSHAYTAGALEKIAQVANACWPMGS